MRRLSICALVLAVSCASGPHRADVRFDVGSNGFVVHAEVADDDTERARGLMDRPSLAADAGMLFVWDDVAARGFYMKNTLIPLDLIAIRAGRVVGIQQMVPCRIADCPTTKTPPADAALEVNAGTAKRAGIKTGALVDSAALP